jgi:hypothetical protein
MSDSPMSDPSMEVVTGNVSVDPIQARRDEIMEIIGDKLRGPRFGLTFKDPNYICSGIFERISSGMMQLKEATQIEIKTNAPMGPPEKIDTFNILDIEMDSFKVISVEDVKAINAKVISDIEKNKKQKTDIEDTKSFELTLEDSDKKYPVEFTLKQKTIEEVIPTVTLFTPEKVMDNLPKQSESPEFKKNFAELSALSTNQADILKGSKLESSIKKVLEKTTSSESETRFTDLKSSILSPVSALNIRLEDSLQKIADAHNTGLKTLLQKTAKAAQETRRRYKNALNETIRKVEDRLKGKTKSVLGSTIKSSKLQLIGKTLNKDVDELAVEIKLVKRYTSVKKKLLALVEGSSDKTPLRKEQIETIVEAFNIDTYESDCDKFIKNMKDNTMGIVAFILRELHKSLTLLRPNNSENTIKFKGIVVNFINGLLKMKKPLGDTKLIGTDIDADSLLTLLKESITEYENNYSSYFSPMAIYDIKETLFEKMMPVVTSHVDDLSSLGPLGSDKDSNSSNTSNSSSVGRRQKEREEQDREYALLTRQVDTFTPIINQVLKGVLKVIPITEPGVLLTTEKQIKGLFSRGTTDVPKHYYLDENGKVKKIGSNTTYKLSIKSDGTIPPQLAHLKPTRVGSDLGNTASLYPVKDEGELFYGRPFKEEEPLNLVRPEPSPLTTGEQGPEPPPQRTFGNRALGFAKGVTRFLRMRTSSKNTPRVKGGKLRTRKHRKNKTHKKR